MSRTHARYFAAVTLLLSLGLGLPAVGESLLGGALQFDLRLSPGPEFDFQQTGFRRAELRLDLFAELEPSERWRLYVEGWLIGGWSFPDAYENVELDEDSPFDYESLQPLQVVLREAYVDLYGFPHRDVDLRVGRQRIAWGVADRISVVDNLNPDDLEDFWDFGRHLPSEALTCTWYSRFFTLQAAYLPLFKPAVLPAGGELAASEPGTPGPAASIPDLSPLVLSDLVLNYSLPGDDPWDNSTLAARLSTRLSDWDLSLSYVYGRQDFPAADTITGTGFPDVNLTIDSSYPRQHVAGLELIGELSGVGLWTEAAFFFPDHRTVTDMTGAGGSRSELRTESYLKAVAGLDYTFSFGPYLNVQYAHGLAFENSREEVEDYFLLGVEWTPPGDRWTLGPLALAVEVDEFDRVRDSWGLLVNPELSFRPFDAVQITAGLRWIEGRKGTTFGTDTDGNELYLKGTFSF